MQAEIQDGGPQTGNTYMQYLSLYTTYSAAHIQIFEKCQLFYIFQNEIYM